MTDSGSVTRSKLSSDIYGDETEEVMRDRVTEFRKRRPRLIDSVVTMAHGAGGKSSAALTDAVFVEAFRNPLLEQLGDGAILPTPSGDRLAFSTDSFVVNPIEFPGGTIDHLAVHGTANDLAVSGAIPQCESRTGSRSTKSFRSIKFAPRARAAWTAACRSATPAAL